MYNVFSLHIGAGRRADSHAHTSLSTRSRPLPPPLRRPAPPRPKGERRRPARTAPCARPRDGAGESGRAGRGRVAGR